MHCIDCHNHLLPGVDDGAGTLQESLDMLRLLRSQGVYRTVLTPHMNTPYVLTPYGKKGLRHIFDCLLEACAGDPGTYPELALGSEYHYDPRYSAAIDPIPMGASRYVLLELPYEADIRTVKEAVDALRGKGFGTLLAHPEKYDAFKYEWAEAHAFLCEEPDVKVQIEAWDTQKHNEYTWRFIESRTAHMLGTDSHGYHRPPVYDLALRARQEWAADDAERRSYVEDLTTHSAEYFFPAQE